MTGVDEQAAATAAGRAGARRPPRRSAGRVTRGVAALVAIALAAVAALAWFDARERSEALRTEVAKRLAATDAALAQAKARDSDQSGEICARRRRKLALLEARLAESQTQQASLEALYRELAPSRDELALNEVEQVLLLASQQLALAGNVQAALAALQLAEASSPASTVRSSLPLRRALARDIDKLKAVPVRRRRGHVAQARPGARRDRHAAARARRAPARPRAGAAAARTSRAGSRSCARRGRE